ncbi:hypothetical protein [Anaerosinus gibii]|uniref:Type II secretion system protein n=1 Tax=Selenobaculum gibii TaxID=3054208 RepID=A0A9Y2AHT9_9FIRM|nr:hypothetical protein [Selenobaculum gbiensis]WIW70026.1 hypothetical protein P3F81_08960 [Selenobaculum gbiensis]
MNQISKNHGFILVDVLTAVIVISIAFISVLGLYIMVSKTNIMNDDEKTAVILARTQINYLKQYEYRGFDRLNLNWWNICPEVYNHPSNRANGQGEHKYTIECTVLPGYDYINETTKSQIIDNNGYPIKSGNKSLIELAEQNNQIISIKNVDDTLPTCEIPNEILSKFDIVPIKITVTWQENINGNSIDRSYEVIKYFLSKPQNL